MKSHELIAALIGGVACIGWCLVCAWATARTMKRAGESDRILRGWRIVKHEEEEL